MSDIVLSKSAERDAAIEALAAAAYERVYHEQTHWADWMYIADGLMVGRRFALAQSGQQEPRGKGYALAFSEWMSTRPWARELDNPTRNDLFWCAEHRSEIEDWRDKMGEHERQKKNHPTHMKRAFLDFHKPPEIEDEAEEKKKKRREKKNADMLALSQELAKARSTIVQMKANPFSWWTGAASDGVRALYEERADGTRAEGKARQLLIALAKEFKAHFPNQTAQLLDELTAILLTSASKTLPAPASKKAPAKKAPAKRAPASKSKKA
jgi:hypothetical protein